MNKTTHVRIRIDDLRNIRKAMQDCDTDHERLAVLWRTSPIRLDDWLSKPLFKYGKKR